MHENETFAAPAANEYLTVDEAIANAPRDLLEEDVEGVFGGKVRIRALTAAQAARVKQTSVQMGQRGAKVDWAQMERLQFQLGVVKPSFTADQVKTLHMQSSESFTKVIEALDRISGTNKQALEEAEAAFQGSDD